MKKMIIFFMVMALMAAGAFGASTKVANSADVRVSMLNQEPDPAEPGRYVDVRFKITNNGSDIANDFVLEILPEFPFSLDAGKSAVEKIGSLHSTGKESEALIVKYRLRVAENALEGDNELKVRYRFSDSQWIEPEPLIINVRTQDAVISIDSVSTGKDDLEPGAKGTLKIKITNTADSALKDIKATVDFGDKKFVTIGSINEKNIYSLDSKQSYEFSFDILVNPETAAGVYQVPLKISYSDKLGSRYTRNGTIGLVVNAKPDISVTLDETEIYSSKMAGEVVVKVVNKGVTDIKFVNMKLLGSESYRILSNREAYLGNIDSDDFETADFRIYVSSKENEFKLPFVLEYKDANNNEYSDNFEIEVPLFSSSEAKKLGLAQNSSKFTWIIAIAVLAVGFFFYRKYRKKKK